MKHYIFFVAFNLAVFSVSAQQTHTTLLAVNQGTACNGIGIASVENQQLSIYPVPAKDEVVIIGLKGNEQAEIYELSGRLIYTFESMNAQSIDVSQLPAGVYLLRIISDETFSAHRLIIRK